MIVGCGGVGLNLIQGAKLASAYPIIGVDVSEEKGKKTFDNGAHFFINIKESNISEELKKMNVDKVDVIIDTTGHVSAITKTLPFLSNTGRYILVGQPKPGASLEIPNANFLFGGQGKSIRATQGGKTSPNQDIPRYIKLHKAGLIDLNKIITHRFNLDNINDAINLLKSGEAGRIIIEIE